MTSKLNERKRRLWPITSILLIGIIACRMLFFQAVFEINVNDEPIGTVPTFAQADQIITEACDSANFKMLDNVDISIIEKIKLKNTAHAMTDLTTTIAKEVGVLTEAAGIHFDDQVLYVKNKSDAEDILNSLLERYTTPDEQIVSKEFLENVEVKTGFVQYESVQDPATVENLILEGYEAAQMYVVEKGDTAYDIAAANSVTLEAMEKANPGINLSKIIPGQELSMKVRTPLISVVITKNETYVEKVPYEVEYVSTSSIYKGDSRITQSGVYGEKEVNADIHYVNGLESNRTVLSERSISEPRTKIVEVGTKKKPKTAATGTFIQPASGRYSSYFGPRPSMGDFHHGLDIANNTGTSIKASDGGKVIFAGWKNSIYGNLVIIDHENGYKTYYAHCSKILVSAGKRVYQGQKIAAMGSTGRSTGPHVHFEVRKNNKATNPLKYLR